MKSIDLDGMTEHFTKETSMKSTQKQYRTTNSWSEDFPVNHLVSLVANAALMTPEERFSSLSPVSSEQKGRDASFLKTSKEFSPMILEKLFSQSSVRWMNWGMMSNGECLTLKISECPKTEKESTLLDILEKNMPWRDPRPAELDNAKSRSNGGPHRPIRLVTETQKALTVQDAYRLLIGCKRNGKLKVRRHTITECERLQGFPDGWTKAVDEKSRFKLLGNAVTVGVVSFVGSAISKFLHKPHVYSIYSEDKTSTTNV